MRSSEKECYRISSGALRRPKFCRCDSNATAELRRTLRVPLTLVGCLHGRQAGGKMALRTLSRTVLRRAGGPRSSVAVLGSLPARCRWVGLGWQRRAGNVSLVRHCNQLHPLWPGYHGYAMSKCGASSVKLLSTGQQSVQGNTWPGTQAVHFIYSVASILRNLPPVAVSIRWMAWSGARPTKHISIEFEIRWKFKTL